METSVDERLGSVVEALSAQISLLRSTGLNESARLLEMAKLEIQLHIHSISDRELRELCELAGERARDAAVERPAVRQQSGGSGAGRASSARVEPMESGPLRTRNPRKHAR